MPTNDKTNPIYLMDGKPHRLCGCDPMVATCRNGGTRSLLTSGFGQCLVPAPDVILSAASPQEGGHCDECDPSFGCWTSSALCSKQVAPASSARPRVAPDPSPEEPYTPERLRAKLNDLHWDDQQYFWLIPDWLRTELMNFLAAPSATRDTIPAELYDGMAVYTAIGVEKTVTIKPYMVAVVLDAVVKLIRKNRSS